MANFGLLKQRYCWVPTIQGWIVMALGFVVPFALFLAFIPSFLAPTHLVPCDLLVVEGWLPRGEFGRVVQTFYNLGCDRIVTTGLPVDGGNLAERAAVIIKGLGVDDDHIIAVPGLLVTRDRTHTSAIALKKWLSTSDIQVEFLNIYSHGIHARRSWFMFDKVIDGEIKVGIIAGGETHYNPWLWWINSKGIRRVIPELAAYVYVRFFYS